jgi:predicted transcriptional regulator
MIMKRSGEEVIEGILELCEEPVSITRIVYQVNLNFKTIKLLHLISH